MDVVTCDSSYFKLELITSSISQCNLVHVYCNYDANYEVKKFEFKKFEFSFDGTKIFFRFDSEELYLKFKKLKYEPEKFHLYFYKDIDLIHVAHNIGVLAYKGPNVLEGFNTFDDLFYGKDIEDMGVALTYQMIKSS